jgi:hypothetical protein
MKSLLQLKDLIESNERYLLGTERHATTAHDFGLLHGVEFLVLTQQHWQD